MDNQLLKFPKYTLLDNIPLELWGHIAQYFYYQFYIGNYGKNYEGFRKISRNEITKDFANYGRKEKVDIIMILAYLRPVIYRQKNIVRQLQI